MPFACTHWFKEYASSPLAEDNYTQQGQNIGPALLPDSDRVEMRAFLSTSGDLEIEAIAQLVRHGNASAGLPGATSVNDGGLFDDGWIIETASYQPPYEPGMNPKYLRFLAQSILETTIQSGITATYGLMIGEGNPRVSVSPLFQFIWNKNLSPNNNEAALYLTVGTTFLF
jgi:hypothetical protein